MTSAAPLSDVDPDVSDPIREKLIAGIKRVTDAIAHWEGATQFRWIHIDLLGIEPPATATESGVARRRFRYACAARDQGDS